MPNKNMRLLKNKYFLSVLILIPYFLYIGFIVYSNRGPVDYETFMNIGNRFLAGVPIYTTNSYYPMPFVMIFSFFALLPRPISMVIWMLGPVICAWLISGKDPLGLLFAPVFGHFVGGQASIFGMLGFWGYRKFRSTRPIYSGILLAMTLLKPQLGIIPIIWAFIEWIKNFKANKQIPIQLITCFVTTAALYLPGFIFLPDWIKLWLQAPRPLFERALAGFVPRTLLFFLNNHSPVYWIALFVIGLIILGIVGFFNKRFLSLDLAMLWGFIVNPLVHDYDLIQLVPLLDTPFKRKIAVLLSIPGWLVILFAYTIDQAWFVFTIIAPGLLVVFLYCQHQSNRFNLAPEKSRVERG